MDKVSPEELKARADALKTMGSDPQIQSFTPDKSDYSSTPVQNGNEIDQNNKNIEKSPEQPINNQQDPGIIDKASKFSQDYQNSPYFKRIFPNGPPALDPTRGGGMVMGEVKAITPALKAAAEEGISLSRIKQLLTNSSPEADGARMFGDSEKVAAARKAADTQADLANIGLSNADKVQRSTEQMNREIDFQNRLAAQKASRK